MSNDTLPGNSAERKALPVATGVLDYFPAAIAELSKVSKFGNDKHNPGEDLHWTRGRSDDHADSMIRHFMDRGGFDPDGIRHSAQMAWRALAILQIELEEAGEAPLSRGSVAAPDQRQEIIEAYLLEKAAISDAHEIDNSYKDGELGDILS